MTISAYANRCIIPPSRTSNPQRLHPINICSLEQQMAVSADMTPALPADRSPIGKGLARQAGLVPSRRASTNSESLQLYACVASYSRYLQ